MPGRGLGIVLSDCNVTLDGVTITGSSEGENSVGGVVLNGGSLDAHNLRIDLDCTVSANCFGVQIGSNATATVRESSIDVHSGELLGGILCAASDVTLQNVAVTVKSTSGHGGTAVSSNDGVSAHEPQAHTITIAGSQLSGDFDSVDFTDDGVGLTVDIADSQLAGRVLDTTPAGSPPVTFRCVGDYDALLNLVPATCK
jgi:hypothetical protein